MQPFNRCPTDTRQKPQGSFRKAGSTPHTHTAQHTQRSNFRRAATFSQIQGTGYNKMPGKENILLGFGLRSSTGRGWGPKEKKHWKSRRNGWVCANFHQIYRLSDLLKSAFHTLENRFCFLCFQIGLLVLQSHYFLFSVALAGLVRFPLRSVISHYVPFELLVHHFYVWECFKLFSLSLSSSRINPLPEPLCHASVIFPFSISNVHKVPVQSSFFSCFNHQTGGNSLWPSICNKMHRWAIVPSSFT